MSPNLPDEIVQARKLFEKYEKSQDKDTRTTFFVEAIELLNSYEDAYPENPHKTLIENLKKTYLRKLLKDLPMVPAENMDEWYGYVDVIIHGGDVLVKVLNEEPALKENLESFIAIYRDDFNRMMERAEKKKQKQKQDDQKDEQDKPLNDQ
jgi:hypothetical protein